MCDSTSVFAVLTVYSASVSADTLANWLLA